NLEMGSFKKAGELNFSIETFRKITQKKESLYLAVFDGMSAAEIYDYTIIDHDKEEDIKRLELLVPLYKLAFFGKQFTDTQSLYLILYKDGLAWFIWKNDFNAPLRDAKITFGEFCDVFNQYIEFCMREKLI